jgi:TPP-dependent pyruvate/acetoin dehydrogenase alpha subunit
MPGFALDGTDLFAVHEAADEAISRARRGEGPTLIECKAFRYYGHFEGDNLSYYTEEEQAEQKARDPIDKFIKRVVDRKLISTEKLEEIDARVTAVIDEAVQLAEDSPYPEVDQVMTDVYVSYQEVMP